jgi:prepilin-type N-terminal cleavage/methylation domain-containing protein
MITKKIKSLNLTACSAKPWHSRGFTLTELLVVIVVIGVIVSGITIAFNTSRVASRDTRRVNEVKALQEALELYKNTERSYPSVITAGNPLVGPISGLTFLQKVPSDPAASDGNCAGLGYQYTATTTGYYYYLLFGTRNGANCRRHSLRQTNGH